MTRFSFILATLALLIGLGGASAGAHSLLTGKDVRNGSLAERDLSKKVRVKLNANKPGSEGPVGPVGPQGDPGADGLDGLPGENGLDGFDGEQGPRGERGPRGDMGDRGPQGPEGPRGPAGRDGMSGLHYTEGVISSYVDQPGKYTVRASCPANKLPISGGYRVTEGDIDVVASYPSLDQGQWSFDIVAGAGSASIVVTAVCIDAS